MTANREAFMARVRTALSAPTSHGRGAIAYAELAPLAVAKRSDAPLELLAENAAALNIQLQLAADPAAAAALIRRIAVETEAEWAQQKALVRWDDALLNELDLETALADTDLPLYRAPLVAPVDTVARDRFHRQLRSAVIGITSADYCVADTATLVLRNRPGQPGAVSLVPSVHVAVVRESQVLVDFVSLYAELAQERRRDREALTGRMTFISGPSKTGDIELVIVHGAHGPRALHLIVLRDPSA